MAVGLPAKTTYADGDVFSASDINDTNGTLNLVGQTTNFYAGKNKIINGDFFVNQRVFTSNTTSGAYNFDRWLQVNSGGSFTVTPQSFTLGAAPVAGYESNNFLRGITATQSAAGDFAYFTQRIENVRTFANSTVVVSFWAKANTGTPKIGVELSQNFGSGGSPSAQVNTALGAITLSTSWVRYSVSVAVPSISGKTLGSDGNSSYLELNLWTSSGATNATRASSIGIQNFTADIWGVQVEAGSTATAFQTATGNIESELLACQRYYAKSYRQGIAPATNGSANGLGFTVGTSSVATSSFFGNVTLPVTMRAIPTITIYSFTSSQTARVSSGDGTDLTANSGSVNLSSERTFTLQNNGVAITPNTGGFTFHYVASAEL
jgi:hypothetical protein